MGGQQRCGAPRYGKTLDLPVASGDDRRPFRRRRAFAMTSPTNAGAPAPDEHHHVAGGIALMLVAVFVFSVNDTLGKWLAGTYSVGQILLFRSAAALVVLTPFVVRTGISVFIHVERPGLQLVRVVLAVGEVTCFYLAVSALPLADTLTYYMASPIFVTLFAAMLLGERVGWRRWTAVSAGFLGVVLALGPSASAFGWPAFVAILGSILFAFLMIATRSLRGTPDVVMIAFHMGGSLIFGIVVAPFHWVAISPFDMTLIAVIGVVAMVALTFVNRSLKLAPASVVVPYQYTVIAWGGIFGFLVFGDIPKPEVVAGAAIIIAAGLYIFFREQRVARRARTELVAKR
jgi:drug/metabolite transporter (DMT)-like permease